MEATKNNSAPGALQSERDSEDLSEGRGNSRIFWILLAITTLWRVMAAGLLDPVYDETYYWYWGMHPQLSYYDHPPLVGWLIWLSSAVFGHTIWSIRIWPVLVGTAVCLIARATTAEMFDRQTGDRAGIIVMLVPGFLGNGILMTPDAPFMLMWALGIWSAWRAISARTHSLFRWLVLGIVIGVGALSKYNMILFALGLCVAWLWGTGDRKKTFVGLVIAGIVSILVFSPVLIWNMQNDWLSFKFQLSHGFRGDDTFPLSTLLEYVGGLMLVATPLLAWQCFTTCVWAFRSREERKKYLASFFWVVIGFFALSALKSRVGPNWPMLAFYTGSILVAEAWPRFSMTMNRWSMGVLVAFTGIGLLGLAWLALPMKLIDKPGFAFPRMEEFRGGEILREAVIEEDAGCSQDFICIRRSNLFTQIEYLCPELEDRLHFHSPEVCRFPWQDAERWDGKNALILSWSDCEEEYLEPYFDEVEAIGEARIREGGGKKRRVLYFFKGIGYHAVKNKEDGTEQS